MKAFDNLCRQNECKFMSYRFLYEYDTICPYYYDYNKCYEKHKGDIEDIDSERFVNNGIARNCNL